MSAYGKAVSFFATLGTAALFSASATAGTDGVVCSDPAIARDLASVVERPAVFREWLHGYLETGYCVTIDAELMGMRMPQGETRGVVLYSIVWPRGELARR